VHPHSHASAAKAKALGFRRNIKGFSSSRQGRIASLGAAAKPKRELRRYTPIARNRSTRIGKEAMLDQQNDAAERGVGRIVRDGHIRLCLAESSVRRCGQEINKNRRQRLQIHRKRLAFRSVPHLFGGSFRAWGHVFAPAVGAAR